jgi:hypothetical protein
MRSRMPTTAMCTLNLLNVVTFEKIRFAALWCGSTLPIRTAAEPLARGMKGRAMAPAPAVKGGRFVGRMWGPKMVNSERLASSNTARGEPDFGYFSLRWSHPPAVTGRQALGRTQWRLLAHSFICHSPAEVSSRCFPIQLFPKSE